jgi:hypothetical protein
MGARHCAAVTGPWAAALHRHRQAARLLAYIARRMPDRDDRPRVELSREAMALAIGYSELTEPARHAVKRAIHVLRVIGALEVARRGGRAGRAHYWLCTSISTPCGKRESGPLNEGAPQGKVAPYLDQSGPLNDRRTLYRDQERPSGKYSAPLARDRFTIIDGGSDVSTRRNQQLALWPAPAPEPSSPAVVTPSAQTLVGEWIEHCAARPPGRVIGQVARLLAEMLAEGVPYDAVRRGLALWMAKGQHPATLPSVVNEAANRRPDLVAADRASTQVSTTQRKIDQALAAGERVAEMMARRAVGT